jgi:3-methyladenine DNA glycosylase AlkC
MKPVPQWKMISKIADIAPLLEQARESPEDVFPAVRALAASPQWETREVAATALVEVSKRHPGLVLKECCRMARDVDPNVRRAASEGLRGLVKKAPEEVRTVLEILKADPDRYVQKSVANVLRNASAKHPEFVLRLCEEWWATGALHTRWVVRDGLRKLKTVRPDDVASITDGQAPSRTSNGT